MGRHRTNGSLRKIGTILLVALSMVNCSNIYEPLTPKNSDEALFEDAKKAANAQNYDLALEKFALLSSEFRALTEVREEYAGALAGKCGLHFSSFLESLEGADFSTTPFFKFFMNAFTGVEVSPSHCTQAEEEMKAIWENETPTASQRLFMSILSMAKMGSYLRNKADRDGDEDLGDGEMDGSFDVCDNVNDEDHFTDEEVTELITGFSLTIENVAGFADSLGLGTTLATINVICTALGGGMCSTTDPESVTAQQVSGMRDILLTGVDSTFAPLGIGDCQPVLDPVTLDACCP